MLSLQEKLDVIEKTELKTGSHPSIKEGSCIMELVSYLANEPWSDNPKCACPVLTQFAIRCNDRWPYERRQNLKKLIPKLLNSRDKSKVKPRYELLVIRNTNVIMPILLDALGLLEEANKCREFKIGEWIEIRDYFRFIRPKISATYAAIYSAAAAAAADAAVADAAAATSAADAAVADAAAATSAADAADAAAAAATYADKEKWLKVRDQIYDETYKSLEMACDV